jgi:16S rRNA (guanine527-N7)-methyltransferase
LRGTELRKSLIAAQRRGFLGPASLEDQLAHSRAFLRLVQSLVLTSAPEPEGPPVVVDLGSGGGVPGLVLAAGLPDCAVILVEGSTTRAAWLSEELATLSAEGGSLCEGCRVVAERAELVGRSPEFRGQAAVVTARAFGSPAVVAECAAPLLRLGGVLVVSEPPRDSGAASRWSLPALEGLGLGAPEPVESGGLSFVLLRQLTVCPERFPRRVGIPGKRPLW